MKRELLDNPDWLYDRYWVDMLSANQIAKMVGCSRCSITRIMKKFGIRLRTVKEHRKLTANRPEQKKLVSEQLKRLWNDKDCAERMSQGLLTSDRVRDLWSDSDFRKTVSNAASKCMKAKWEDPEFRETVSEIVSQSQKIWWKEHPEYLEYHREVMRECMLGANNPAWNGGISIKPYTPEFNEEFKEYIRARQNYHCFICGKRKRTLDVHHIDYDKTNTTPENCAGLCKRCHGKTNHNREEWLQWFTENWIYQPSFMS